MASGFLTLVKVIELVAGRLLLSNWPGHTGQPSSRCCEPGRRHSCPRPRCSSGLAPTPLAQRFLAAVIGLLALEHQAEEDAYHERRQRRAPNDLPGVPVGPKPGVDDNAVGGRVEQQAGCSLLNGSPWNGGTSGQFAMSSSTAPELADMPMELPRRDRHGLSHTGHAGQYGEGGRDQPESCGRRAAAHTMPVAEVARTVVFRPEEGYLNVLMTAATAVDVRPNSRLVKRRSDATRPRRSDATRPRIIAMLSHGARCVCHLGGLILSFARLAWSRRDSKPLPQGFGPGAGR